MAGKGKIALFLIMAHVLFYTGWAMAHGSVVTLKGMEDPARVYGDGVKLIAFQGGGNIKGLGWLLAVTPDGKKAGLVGVAREETHHGRLVQATCMDLERNIIEVVVLRVMEDEKKEVDALIELPEWWKIAPAQKLSGAALVLRNSVMKVQAASGEVVIP
ncbi:MAG: hypothetical protein OEZ55_09670 [Nitrospinota bacterium]|nr:hypothetical protein [Nitrospinota bacterium]